MLPKYINSADDLVTPRGRVAEGFLEQAISKVSKAAPYLDEGEELKSRLDEAGDIEAAIADKTIRGYLLAAAGFSDKARVHFSESELTNSLHRVIDLIASRAGDLWRDETLYRFFLTKGDSLGGSMRNQTGAIAGKRFADAMLSELDKRNMNPVPQASSRGKVQGIRWDNREMLFDKTPKFIGKNIDVILLDTDICQGTLSEKMQNRQGFLACGEIKGGIDPAGADEHWKTANSALSRIREAFSNGDRPHLFFIGASIEESMSNEIFSQLKDGSLGYAANLTVPAQLDDLVCWLVGL